MPTSSGFQINEVLTAQNTNTYLLRANRNCIINGSIAIAQRSSSVAGITSAGYFTADRWYHTINAAGTWTDSVQVISASDAPLADGVRNSLKVTCTTATGALGAGSYNAIVQSVEGYNLQQFAKGNSSAKYFALSFWVKSNAVGTYIAELFDNDNNRTVSAAYTITNSGVWQKVRLVFPSDSTGAFDNDNGASLSLFFWIGAGSAYNSATLNTSWATNTNNKRATGQTNVGVAVNNYFEITGVQLEPNSVCTPYEVRDYATELALCQRYFFKITGTVGNYEPVASAGVNVSATGHVRTTVVTPVPMRKVLVTADMAWATLVAYDGAGITFVTAGSIVGNSINSTMVSIDWSSAGSLTTGRPVVILTQLGSSAYYFQLSAEL